MNSLKFARFINIVPMMKRNYSNKMEKPQYNYFLNGIYSQPHPEKISKGGEDSHFLDTNILSVADGVGGWNDVGVDPSKYSNKLMFNISNLIKNPLKVIDYLKDPKSLIVDSSRLNKEKGSSTLLILALDKEENILRSSLIGDSSYLILRPIENNDFKIIYKSEEQQHSFNFPYQIGTNGDNPKKAYSNIHKDVKNNDIVILGTDGLFDNIDENQIKEFIKNYSIKNNIINPQDLSEKLGNYVYKLSLDNNHNSPFSINAKKNYFNYIGGKSDDITIIVGICNIIKN